jgi:hypothetical protein
MSYCPTFHTSRSFLCSALGNQPETLFMRDEPVSVPGGDDPKPQLGPDQRPDPADESKKSDFGKNKKNTD